MPEDFKKNQQKAKHDPKEQRKPRQRNHPAPTAEKNVERKSETKMKVPAQTKPVHEDPGPEFFKGLKRETDEILKITEEANSKYKKKEIQSNWAKYEMPIESYEEMEEHESMGADYEKLIQAPLSIGGHFQFKHEKSWDLNTGPSLYDNHFDINMDNLASALLTIPFYERNSLDKGLFSQTDITNMDNRSTRYKQKYYNDKCFTTTPEVESDEIEKETAKHTSEKNDCCQDILLEKTTNYNKPRRDNEEVKPNYNQSKDNDETNTIKEISIDISKKQEQSLGNEDIYDDLDDILLDVPVDNVGRPLGKNVYMTAKIQESCPQRAVDRSLYSVDKTAKIIENCPQQASTAMKQTKDIVSSPSKSAKAPVVESPEDLEKWLDDFLES